MRRMVLGVLAVVLMSSAALGEVVWRSATSGVLPALANAAPPVPAQPLAASYAGQRQAFGRGELVTIKPTVTGGSGRFEWWWPAISALPPGLVFNSDTGAFSGRTQAVGQYRWSVLVHDLDTGETAGAVAVLFIEP